MYLRLPSMAAVSAIPLPSESVLQYAWAQRRFRAEGLTTRTGEAVQIVQTGRRNSDQGPDFLQAEIRVGELTLFGNIELHLQSRHWAEHGHNSDTGYNNVVLHVVASGPAAEVRRADGTSIPEVSLEGRLDDDLQTAYASLTGDPQPVPCARRLPTISRYEINQWVHRQAIARVERKANGLLTEVPQLVGDWGQQLLVALAGGFGGPQNGSAFRQVAAALPLRILQRHAADLAMTEALLFGLGGLLESQPLDAYQAQMAEHWHYLQQLHGIGPVPDLPPLAFLRMRPAGFPTLRLAQLAAVLHRHSSIQLGLNLVSLLDGNAQTINAWLDAEPSSYWQRHYRFGHGVGQQRALASSRRPGRQLREHLIINVLVPFAYHYHQARGKPDAAERAVDQLTHLPAERNAAVAPFALGGLKPKDALESQGLLQLVRDYCSARRCAECAIGHQLLRPANAQNDL